MEAFGPASTASTAFCWLQQPRRACANLTCFPWSWRKLKHFRCWQVKSSANVCLTLLLSLLISGNLFATAPLRLSRSIRSVPSAKKRSGARWTASVLDAQGVGVSGCTGLTRCAIGPRQCGFVTSGRSWLAKGLILRGEVDDDKVSIHYFNLLVQTAVVSLIINLPFGVIQLSIYDHIWDGL